MNDSSAINGPTNGDDEPVNPVEYQVVFEDQYTATWRCLRVRCHRMSFDYRGNISFEDDDLGVVAAFGPGKWNSCMLLDTPAVVPDKDQG